MWTWTSHVSTFPVPWPTQESFAPPHLGFPEVPSDRLLRADAGTERRNTPHLASFGQRPWLLVDTPIQLTRNKCTRTFNFLPNKHVIVPRIATAFSRAHSVPVQPSLKPGANILVQEPGVGTLSLGWLIFHVPFHSLGHSSLQRHDIIAGHLNQFVRSPALQRTWLIPWPGSPLDMGVSTQKAVHFIRRQRGHIGTCLRGGILPFVVLTAMLSQVLMNPRSSRTMLIHRAFVSSVERQCRTAVERVAHEHHAAEEIRAYQRTRRSRHGTTVTPYDARY